MHKIQHLIKIAKSAIGIVVVFSVGLGIGIQFLEDKEGHISLHSNKSRNQSPSSADEKNMPLVNELVSSLKAGEVSETENLDITKNTLIDPEEQSNKPQWINNAVPFVVKPGFSLISIVLDDMGLNLRRSKEVIELQGPLTLSYLSYARDLIQQTSLASSMGHELLLHLPMEPYGHEDPGPGALLVGLKELELRKRLNSALGKFPNFIGVNNHMGSRFTADLSSMRFLLSDLKKKEYLFLDSVTTSRSVAVKVGRVLDMPIVTRDVFLDDTNSEREILLRLRQTELIAKKTGTAIAIGHPRRVTLNTLKEWMKNLKKKKIELAPLSAIAKIRLGEAKRKMISK